MADGMLPAFEIRNLRSSNDSNQANALVRVSAPNYNRTIATAPAAKLKYKDEENDTIVVSVYHGYASSITLLIFLSTAGFFP